jgi:integrase
MSLGKFPATSPMQALARLNDATKLVAARIDPVQQNRDDKIKARSDATSFATALDLFATVFTGRPATADMVKDLKRHGGLLMPVPIAKIDTPTVARALASLHAAYPRQAQRILAQVARVLDFARVKGLRSGDNPAAWRGTFQYLWDVPKGGPGHKALRYTLIPELWTELVEYDTATSLALRMLLLCASRTSEILGAQWDEIDMSVRTWTIPAKRMKARKEHVVPLSDGAIAVLGAARQHDGDWGHIFKGVGKGKLSTRSLEAFLHRTVKRTDTSVHGLRSAFRDWCGDCTDVPREVAEAALAHTVGGVEGAYRRGSALEKRRHLMQAWGDYVTGAVVSNVLPFAAAR